VLGDNAEVQSLLDFYSRKSKEGEGKTLWLGGNKSIFGHTEPVSGLLSIAKLVTAFQKGIMPPTLMVRDPSEPMQHLMNEFDIDVVQTPTPLELVGQGLFGLTASGMSGTTTHVIIRPPTREEILHTREASFPTLIEIPGHSPRACKDWKDSFAQKMDNVSMDDDITFADQGFLRMKAPSAVTTVAVFGDSILPAESIQKQPVIRNPVPSVNGNSTAPVALVFGGVGLVQYGAGRDLYENWPDFRTEVDKVDGLFRSVPQELFHGRSVAHLCGMAVGASCNCGVNELTCPLQYDAPKVGSMLKTELMQATTFLIQYCSAVALTKAFNLEISAVVGHSFGEIIVAAFSGAITLEAAVEITVLRTVLSLSVERTNNKELGMMLCSQVSSSEILSLCPSIGKGTFPGVSIGGYLGPKEVLLSGFKDELESCKKTLDHKGATCSWVDSTVAYHSPQVYSIGDHLKKHVTAMIKQGRLFNNDSNVTMDMFVTSVGDKISKKKVQTSQYWKTGVNDPIHLQSVLEKLDISFSGQKEQPLILDMSARGLLVQWFKRNNGEEVALTNIRHRVVPSPAFSWDFARVFKNKRPSSKSGLLGKGKRTKRTRESKIDNRSSKRLKTSSYSPPAYPFTKKICNDIPDSHLVRPYKHQENASASVYARTTCLVNAWREPEVNPRSILKDECVGIDAVCAGGSLWESIFGMGNHRLIKDWKQLSSDPAWKKGPKRKILVVMGPLQDSEVLPGWENANSLETAVSFVDVLQRMLLLDDSPIRGIVFVTADDSHPAFEFACGSAATLRLQIPHIEFVSTLRLDGINTNDKHVPSEIMENAISAAIDGETVMRVDEKKTLTALRMVPMTKGLEWETPWVKTDCLYVITGGTSGLARSLLPTLATLGVRHFLLLIHRRKPEEDFIHSLRRNGAKTIIISSCNVRNETSIRSCVADAIKKSGAKRVAGAFHLSASDDQKSFDLPVPRDLLLATVSVKFEIHTKLLDSLDLKPGDIFSVAGSVSTVLGSKGIAYAAVNHACRALQRQANMRGLIAPYPILGISHYTGTVSTLWHGDIFHMTRVTGMSPCSYSALNLSMLHSRSTPTTTEDLAFFRFEPMKVDAYLNATSPNRLFDEIVKITASEKTTPLVDIMKRDSPQQHKTKPKTILSGPDASTSLSEVLVTAIADVSGLSSQEVREHANENTLLDETYAIDSISAIRLHRRIEQLGYSIPKETVVSSTFGMVLEQMRVASAHKEQIPTVDQDGKEQEQEQSFPTPMDQEDTLGFKIPDEKLPVPLEIMKQAALGHNTAAGAIIPSLWYAMVGLSVFGASVKVTLYRMSPTNIESATVQYNDDHQALTFLTSLPEKGPELCAQVATTKEKIDQVSGLSEDETSFEIDGDDIYDVWARRAGFAYTHKYRSLRNMKFYGQVDESNESNFLHSVNLRSTGSIQNLSTDPMIARAEIVLTILDAGLQCMIIGNGSTFAPAKAVFQVETPMGEWKTLLNKANGTFTISTKFTSTTASLLEGVSTVYIRDTPIYTTKCVFKGLPIAIGARLYPQFFCKHPKHTMICLHEAGGTSRIYTPLCDMMASHGVRVLSIDFPQHGRRTMQTDEAIITSMPPVIEDIMPWLNQQLKDHSGATIPYTVLGLSSGGVVAYGLLRDALLPGGLKPKMFINMMSQPPQFPNEHVERTYQSTVENIGTVLSYYSILAGVDLTYLNEGQPTADRARSVLGVVHELTNEANTTSRKLLDIPTYVYGVPNDPVVPYSNLCRWSEVIEKNSLVNPKPRMLRDGLSHFLGLTGQAEEALGQVFFGDGVINEMLST